MREIIIEDGLPPQEIAMAQAMYSRDPKSVRVHIEAVKSKGPEAFLTRYYKAGYGHRSICDCGTTTVCFENVSLLAAKALQDWPLYNGQEASTRYLSMSKQECLDPFGSVLSKSIIKRWMSFYERALEELVPYLKENHPQKPEVKDTIYEKSIKALAFDVARGYLPAGITTYVALHMNLRQIGDHRKATLKYHPLPEVREIDKELLAALLEKYNASFSDKEYPEEEAWLEACAQQYYYEASLPDGFSAKSFFEEYSIDQHRALLEKRPPKSEIPHRFRQYGEIVFTFALDFGSYRDLQRQRSCVLEMPLLTPERFAPWYLEQLPEKLRRDAEFLVAQQQASLHALAADGCPKELLQYYCALGFEVPVKMTANLPSAVYIAELRSGETVHPTLRLPAQQMGKALKDIFEWLPIYIDESKVWTAKRGAQDIVRVEK